MAMKSAAPPAAPKAPVFRFTPEQQQSGAPGSGNFARRPTSAFRPLGDDDDGDLLGIGQKKKRSGVSQESQGGVF